MLFLLLKIIFYFGCAFRKGIQLKDIELLRGTHEEKSKQEKGSAMDYDYQFHDLYADSTDYCKFHQY